MPPKKSKVVKPVVEVPEVVVPIIVAEVVAPVVTVTEPIIEKKKTKKAPKIVATVTPEGITGNFQGEVRRPLIAHLQVNSSTVNFTNFPISYDPNPPAQPEPYEPGFDNYFSNQNEALLLQGITQVQVNTEDVTKTTSSVAIIVKNENDPLPCFKKYDLMVQYRDTQTSMKLPTKTDVACFWCAHTFVNQPCILPEREEKGTYHVWLFSIVSMVRRVSMLVFSLHLLALH